MFRASHSSRSCRGGMLSSNCLTADACFTGSFHFRLPVALPQTTMESKRGHTKTAVLVIKAYVSLHHLLGDMSAVECKAWDVWTGGPMLSSWLV